MFAAQHGSNQLLEHEFCFYCSYVDITMELNTDIYSYSKLNILCLINILFNPLSIYSDWFWSDLSVTTNSKQYSLPKVCMLSGLSQNVYSNDCPNCRTKGQTGTTTPTVYCYAITDHLFYLLAFVLFYFTTQSILII